MSIISNRAEPDDPSVAIALQGLLEGTPGLTGALIASLDGHPVAAVLPDHEPGSTAAVVAASLGLGERLSDLTGEEPLQEIVVRSGSGYVVIYSVGRRGVLTVLARRSVNLALLHLRARELSAELADQIDADVEAR